MVYDGKRAAHKVGIRFQNSLIQTFKEMNLKNYTSGVSSDITIARIERFLVDAGAQGIAKDYKNNSVQSLVFSISYDPNKMPMTVRLPANVEKCMDSFYADYRKSATQWSKKTREDFREQAAKTAWKLIQDWVEVQVSLIKLGQQEVMQAFLAYAWNGERTFYEQIKAGGFKQLAAPKSE